MTMYMVDAIVTFPGGESGEWLPLANCHLGQGDIYPGRVKPGKKQRPRIFFIGNNFSYLGEEFCTQHSMCS